MARDKREGIETLRERLEAGERGGSAPDREQLLEFSDQLFLLSSEYSDGRHLKLLRHCTRMSENAAADLADALEDRDAAEAIVRWINKEYDNPETNRDYRLALRVFGKRVERADEPPESLAWIPTKTPSNYDPMPREPDLLTWDDLQDLLDAATNPRDRALIAVQFEAGLRSGELRNLSVGDVYDSEHSIGLHVGGKEGERAVHLIVATPYLRRWLEAHPARDDDTAPLWCKLSTAEEQSYQAWLSGFKETAERAGIEKPVTPTNFRKSNTRWLIRQGMSQTEIEDRQGRTRGSDSTARYMARFGEESSERRYAELHGKEVETEGGEDRTPIECPRCTKETPRDRDFCVWCDQALTHEAATDLEEVEDATFESATGAETQQQTADIRTVKRAVDRSPAIVRHMTDGG